MRREAVALETERTYPKSSPNIYLTKFTVIVLFWQCILKGSPTRKDLEQHGMALCRILVRIEAEACLSFPSTEYIELQ